MDRRSFVQSVAGASALAAPQGLAASTRLYRIEYFYYRQGDQVNRLHQFFSSQAPLFLKHMRSFGVFTAVMAPHAQTMMVLSGFADAADMAAAARNIEADVPKSRSFTARACIPFCTPTRSPDPTCRTSPT